jgi:hypothetical protein
MALIVVTLLRAVLVGAGRSGAGGFGTGVLGTGPPAALRRRGMHPALGRENRMRTCVPNIHSIEQTFKWANHISRQSRDTLEHLFDMTSIAG